MPFFCLFDKFTFFYLPKARKVCILPASLPDSSKQNGVLAQLVEHFNGIEGVSGSSPLCSTSTDRRQIFRKSAACFIFAYGLACYVLPCCIPVGAKSGR